MRSKARIAVAVALALWLAGGIALGGILLLKHTVPLPVPAQDDAVLRDAIAALPGPGDRWRAVHVMYRSCPCSQRTITHLLDDARPADLDEHVVMIDDDGLAGPEDARLRARFHVEVVTPARFHAVFGAEAAPLFVVARPGGELAYVGGYNRHKQSARYEDASIIADLRRDGASAALPVYGCATSARLADTIDPLGLRRW
jgi:hypothetical protein